MLGVFLVARLAKSYREGGTREGGGCWGGGCVLVGVHACGFVAVSWGLIAQTESVLQEAERQEALRLALLAAKEDIERRVRKQYERELRAERRRWEVYCPFPHSLSLVSSPYPNVPLLL